MSILDVLRYFKCIYKKKINVLDDANEIAQKILKMREKPKLKNIISSNKLLVVFEWAACKIGTIWHLLVIVWQERKQIVFVLNEGESTDKLPSRINIEKNNSRSKLSDFVTSKSALLIVWYFSGIFEYQFQFVSRQSSFYYMKKECSAI